MRHNFLLILLGFLFINATCAQVPGIPQNLVATAYERHIDLSWSAAANALSYQIFRSSDGGVNYTSLKTVSTTSTFDWTGDEGLQLTRNYKVKAVSANGTLSDFSASVTASTVNMTDDAMMEMVQRATFRYFWDFGHPVSGMARERNGDLATVTTGGTGFGVMSMVVATERGWVTREAAVNRLLQIVSFLQIADRYHGAFPHWMNGSTGKTKPFSQFDDGADLVETAFLIQGLLTARQYFDQNTALESALRDIITQLWEEVEWDWFRKNNSPVLYWHWSPNYGWQMNFALRGFNEVMITYLLAIASPTHPVPASLFATGWKSNNYINNASHWGYKVYCGPALGGPLFFAHYSFLGFDPRNKKDNVCNYFTRNRNHTLINRQYCVLNPEGHAGYSADCWGLTASDDPWGYLAHDPLPQNDNGTISPTAALSSMPYTPAESMDALRHFYRVRGDKLWGDYGFYDAFNPGANWTANSYLAIDQGPIIVMIENHRTGLLWEKFMQNPEIQPMLDAIGFQPDVMAANDIATIDAGFSLQLTPNPVVSGEKLQLSISIEENPQTLNAYLINANGQQLQSLFISEKLTQGIHSIQLDLGILPTGTYFIGVQNEKGTVLTQSVIVRL